MSDDEGFKRKSTRMAAIEAAKRIKKNAEDNAQKYPLYRAELVTVTLSDVVTSDNNTPGRRGRKGMIEDQVFDSIEILQDSSKNISKCSNSPKSDDMPKKRRGRPPKLESTKCPSMRSRNTKYKYPRCEDEADYDVNLRRESYNSCLLNNEAIVPTLFSGPKQLHVGNGGISYRESLLKFTKDLGPTAQNVARRMLQRQGLANPAQHQLEPLFQSPDPLRRPHVLDKGKNIMVDDGKSNRNKWDIGTNLDLLFGKQKGGVKIGNNSSLDYNQDFGNENLDHAQVGDYQRSINQIGPFSSSYNINKSYVIEDISGQKEVSWTTSNQKQISSVYPSTYLSPPRNVSSPFSWVQQPLMHTPTPVQPPPPASSFNSVANDNFLKEKEFQLALALSMQMKDQQPNVLSRNLGGPSQINQFLQAQAHGPDRQQPQDRLIMPMQPQFWSQMVVSGANNPEQGPLPFGTSQDSGFPMGINHMLHPPPGI